MGTTAISSATTPTSADSAASTTGSNTLGKDDFLKLLTAQLSNQDPLQPVDNQSFIAQLAQFSSVEQLQNVSSQLDTLLTAAASANQMSATSLVGKNVAFNADGVDVANGSASALRVNLPASATVTAVVQDASGRTVRTLALGAHGAGTFDLAWDGRDASGAAVPAGHYTVTLSAKAADGTDVTAGESARGLATGVAFDGGAAVLLVGGAQVKLSDVVEIDQP